MSRGSVLLSLFDSFSMPDSEEQVSRACSVRNRSVLSDYEVLVASVHDVRQMATILRGVNIHGVCEQI